MKMAMGAAAAAAVVGTGIAVASTRTPPSPYVPDKFRFFLHKHILNNTSIPLLKQDSISYFQVLKTYALSRVPEDVKNYIRIGRDELQRNGYLMGEDAEAKRYFQNWHDPEHMSNDKLDKAYKEWKSKNTLYDKMYLLELNSEKSKRDVSFLLSTLK